MNKQTMVMVLPVYVSLYKRINRHSLNLNALHNIRTGVFEIIYFLLPHVIFTFQNEDEIHYIVFYKVMKALLMSVA